jgi:hypothetical protein
MENKKYHKDLLKTIMTGGTSGSFLLFFALFSLTIVLSGLQITASDYAVGIFTLF